MNRVEHCRGAFAPEHFEPGKTWQIDLMGPLPGAKQFPKGLVIVDLGSRQIMAWPLARTTARDVIIKLELALALWGSPIEIQSDGGPPFTSLKIEEFSKRHNIHWHVHLAYHPESNGVVERRIGILKQRLQLMGNGSNYKGWHLHLSQALIQMNLSASRWPERTPQPQHPWTPKYAPGNKVWVSIPGDKDSEPMLTEIVSSGQYPNTYLIKEPHVWVHHNWLSRFN